MEQDSDSPSQRVARKGHMTSTACLLCRKQKVKVISPLSRYPEVSVYADIGFEVLWRETDMQ
jgi:hypothetical protein